MATEIGKTRPHAGDSPLRVLDLDLAAVTLVALAVRLCWVLVRPWEAGDSAWYIAVARNIAFYHVFSADPSHQAPTAYRAPLYPSLIAALWFGESAPVLLVLLFQAALGAITVSLVYLIARHRFRRSTAMLAGYGMALAPMSSHFAAVILSETLFTLLVILAAFLWARRRSVGAGVVFGLAALTRPILVPFLVLLLLLTLIPAWQTKRRQFATMALVGLAVSSVWIARNALVFRQFIPIAAAGYGTNLLVGAMDTRDADDGPTRKALLASVGVSPNETELDQARLREAIRRIRSEPLNWFRARAQQYPRLFYDSGSYVFADERASLRSVLREGPLYVAVIRVGFILGNLTVFLLALVGIVQERARFVSLSHLTLFPIFLSVIHLPSWVEPRYGLSMMPLIAVLAAAACQNTALKVARGARTLSRQPPEVLLKTGLF